MDGSCHLILLRFMMLPSLSPTPFNMVHLHTRTLIEETQNIRLYSQTLINLTASVSFFSHFLVPPFLSPELTVLTLGLSSSFPIPPSLPLCLSSSCR